MIFVARDFNTPTNDIGYILLYLSNRNKICINILDLHEDGQAWMYIKYPLNMDIYDIIISIFDSIVNEIAINNVFIKEDTFQDIVSLDEPIENCLYSNQWGNHVPFTRESVALLEEYESDRDEDEDEKNMDDYVIKGEFLENGEITFNKPIRSNTYYIYNKNKK